MGYKAKDEKKIALERIRILFKQAEDTFKEDLTLANRYVFLAREISMKHKVRIPSDLKRKYCKKCLNFLMPSVNCRVRLQKGKVVYYCTNCRNYSRFPYTKEKKALKQALKFNQK